MMAFSPNEVESLKAVASMLVQELRDRLTGYSTTLQQDERLLSDMQRCTAQAGGQGEGRALSDEAECTESALDDDWGHALQMAVEYRIERKRLIHRVIERLAKDCAEITVTADEVPALELEETSSSDEWLSDEDDVHESEEL